jgi:hypothetical protein
VGEGVGSRAASNQRVSSEQSGRGGGLGFARRLFRAIQESSSGRGRGFRPSTFLAFIERRAIAVQARYGGSPR